MRNAPCNRCALHIAMGKRWDADVECIELHRLQHCLVTIEGARLKRRSSLFGTVHVGIGEGYDFHVIETRQDIEVSVGDATGTYETDTCRAEFGGFLQCSICHGRCSGKRVGRCAEASVAA